MLTPREILINVFLIILAAYLLRLVWLYHYQPSGTSLNFGQVLFSGASVSLDMLFFWMIIAVLVFTATISSVAFAVARRYEVATAQEQLKADRIAKAARDGQY